MPPGLLPEHKAAVVLFMERVYGLSDPDTFVRLLENAFLPDMRAVTLLDSVCCTFGVLNFTRAQFSNDDF